MAKIIKSENFKPDFTKENYVYAFLLSSGLNEKQVKVEDAAFLINASCEKYKVPCKRVTLDSDDAGLSALRNQYDVDLIKDVGIVNPRPTSVQTFQDEKGDYHHVRFFTLSAKEVEKVLDKNSTLKKVSIKDESLLNPRNFENPILVEAIKNLLPKSDKYELIGNQEAIRGEKNMVFALIYADDAQPYKAATIGCLDGTTINHQDYDFFTQHKDPAVQAKVNLNIPMVLAQMRWDGKLGFVGGNMEKHHTSLIEALRDELEEEIGWNLTPTELEAIAKPHATYAKNGRHIVSYKIKVTAKQLIQLQQNAKAGKHFISENCGNVLFQIHENSVNSLLSQTFSGTGCMELEKLIKDENLLGKVAIKQEAKAVRGFGK